MSEKRGVSLVTLIARHPVLQHLVSQIRVNAVNPTVVLTDLGRAHWGNPEMGKPMLEKIPLGRFAGKKTARGR